MEPVNHFDSSTYSMTEFIDLLKDADGTSSALEEEPSGAIPYRSRCNTWPKRQYPSVSDTENGADQQSQSNGLQVTPPSSVYPTLASPYNNPMKANDLHQVPLGQEEASFSPNTTASLVTNPLPLVCEEEPAVDLKEEEKEGMTPTTPEMEFGNHSSPGGSLMIRSKSSSRRNPWGNMSYADLITQAIETSPDKRLTLAQIYEWLVKNVSYFSGKSDSMSSIGWKNSIRHNLSLHNRFVRVQNEGAGKSSWWTLNPEMSPKQPAKHANRRRANTLDLGSKLDQRRKVRGAGKRRSDILGKNAAGSQLRRAASNSSILSDSLSVTDLASPENSRRRTFSNASSCGGRLSPAFRPRTFSNTSSCDHSSPPNEYSLDSTSMSLSPWQQQPSPNFNLADRIKLEDSCDLSQVQDQIQPQADPLLSEEDLESLKLLNLTLDEKSSQFLLEALRKEENLTVLEQDSNNSLDSVSSPPSDPGFGNSMLMSPNNLNVDQFGNGQEVTTSFNNLNGHKIKILEPRECGPTSAEPQQGFSSTSENSMPHKSGGLNVLNSPSFYGRNGMSGLHKPNETRQLRQLLCIREHQSRQQKLQQQSMMLSGGSVVGVSPQNTNYIPFERPNSRSFLGPVSSDSCQSLSTVRENANESSYSEDLLSTDPNSVPFAEFDFDISEMQGVDPVSVGGFPVCNNNQTNLGNSCVSSSTGNALSLGTTC